MTLTQFTALCFATFGGVAGTLTLIHFAATVAMKRAARRREERR